ncbi:hypothetical protein CVV68_19795 [Arthrobacter livingstonensis]|uniref:Uncharacterized protein n=1 Tax=Arthrobacter livingstonensis TaxID=670078 RepID=A0A2V5L1P0_9MICC|nr:hypothetical protein [Arthrobacter livingstonensis]PYI65075.1 hypothetical protein CVV68_19795 [Arthrobacter livingstonensis]
MPDDPLPGGELPACVAAPRATWRVSVDVRDLDDRPLAALRLLLVADVLRRLVEDLQGGLVLLVLLESRTGPSAIAREDAEKALWIRPPMARTGSPTEVAALLGAPPNIVLIPTVPSSSTAGAPDPEYTLRVAVALLPHRGTGLATSGLLGIYDPLALRLALLRFPYPSPAVLTTARLHRAQETLQRWRLKVADWEDMPPAPMPQHSVDAMRAALVAGLDTVTVLKLLHRMEVDLHLASGSKFETFAYLDRVLALDLCHLVGKVRK